MKALIIEDDGFQAQLLATILERWNYDSDLADDAIQAIDFFERNDYDVIFCDIWLQDDDGFEVMAYFRKYDRKSLIVGMSAHGQEALEYQLRRFGVDDFLFKPYDEDEIAQILGMSPGTPSTSSKAIHLLEKLVGGSGLTGQLIQLFLEEMSVARIDIETAIRDRDKKTALMRLHQLKGSCYLLGALQLAEEIQLLEGALKQDLPGDNIFESVKDQLVTLSDQMQEACAQ